jgi:hypothetical protein
MKTPKKTIAVAAGRVVPVAADLLRALADAREKGATPNEVQAAILYFLVAWSFACGRSKEQLLHDIPHDLFLNYDGLAESWKEFRAKKEGMP